MGRVLIGAVVFGVIVVLAAVAAYYWARRAIRRRWQRWQAVSGGSVARYAGTLVGRIDPAELAALDPRNRAARAAFGARRRMQRSVAEASHAVAGAVGQGAAVGDLPLLVRRTEKAATDVDVLLRVQARKLASGDAPGVDDALGQAAMVAAAADRIREAATLSLREHSGPNARAVAEAADHEAVAILAGLSRSRGV